MRLLSMNLVALALSVNAVFPAHANVLDDKGQHLPPAPDHRLFSDSADLGDVKILSLDEMHSTEGAINPFVAGAAIGAGVNGIKYGVGVALDKDRSFDKAELAKTMAAGAGIGALTGPAAGAAGGGLSVGANVWRFNGAAANFAADKAMNAGGPNQNGRPPR